MKNKICVVTGGCGFIGSHLVDLLINKGFKVRVIDNLSTGNKSNLNKKAKFYKFDLSKNSKWEKAFKNATFVFHLAGLAELVSSIKNYKKYFDSNVVSTFNIFNVVKKYKCKKIIYTASSTCYGIPRKFPTPETYPSAPIHPYAITKYLGEELILKFSKLFDINCISARLFNVYGPRVRGSKGYGSMFTVFLTQKYFNQPFTVVGNGKQKRDFTYVSDVCQALYLLAINKRVKYGIFNIGSGKTVSINKIVSLMSGKKIHIPKRPGEPDITFGDIKKIFKAINWKPKISIEKGIKTMLENIEFYKNLPFWNKNKIKIVTKDWFKYLKKNTLS
jgi:UDP-glucose 4-epimerase